MKPCETAGVAIAWLWEGFCFCWESVVDEECLYRPSLRLYHMCANINSLASVVATGLITYYQCYLFPKGAVRELSLALHFCKHVCFNLSCSFIQVRIFLVIIMQLILCMISGSEIVILSIWNISRWIQVIGVPWIVVVSWDANKYDLQLSFISHPNTACENGILVSFVRLRNNSRRNEGTTPEKRFKFDTAGAKSFLLGLLTVVKSPETYFWHFFNVPFLRSGLYQLCQMRALKLSDLSKQNF